MRQDNIRDTLAYFIPEAKCKDVRVSETTFSETTFRIDNIFTY